MAIYKNRVVWNQRGGSLVIDNTTEREKIKLSHRSGSNINLTNVVTSELATNNKQTNVVHDLFETVGNDKTEFVGKNHTFRTGENIYQLKGFIDQSQLDAIKEWKNTYSPIANLNSQFKINRGGVSYPNGNITPSSGERDKNPVIGSSTFTVENKFTGYVGVPIRKSDVDGVTSYASVPDRGHTIAAQPRKITEKDITQAAGPFGSKAPGVLEFGSANSAATENGTWTPNNPAQKINEALLNIQDTLTPIEQRMGNGGDETYFTKRNKFEQIGAVFNDYPSIRIDEHGRSQPFEMLVSETGTFKNHDYIPHIEEVDNSANFPGGNDDKVVGNRYSRTVGSGGISLKTTGSTEMGGTILKGGYKEIKLNATHGIMIGSERSLELQSLKTITLRTNRQVYVESAMGVKGNLIVGGGISVEGELYCQHITAPLEVHQTEDTVLMGKFATDTDDSLVIGYAHIGDRKYPVYGLAADNLIINYPHSHHHNGIPMRLTQSNKDVRNFAASENINAHNNISQALPQNHERKAARIAPSPS